MRSGAIPNIESYAEFPVFTCLFYIQFECLFALSIHSFPLFVSILDQGHNNSLVNPLEFDFKRISAIARLTELDTEYGAFGNHPQSLCTSQ